MTKAMTCDLRDALRIAARLSDPAETTKGTDADLMRQAAAKLDEAVARMEGLEVSLRDLHSACVDAYKAGRIAAEPFVRASNAIAALDGKDGAL